MAVLLLFISCEIDNPDVLNDQGTGFAGTMRVTICMPGDTPQTRISLDPANDGSGTISLAWQEGDQIDLLVVYNVGGQEKQKKQTVAVEVDKTNPKTATFPLTLPDEDYEEFNLYCVYGGGGLNNENHPDLVKLPTLEQSTSSSLKEIEKNKAIVLVFEKKGINKNELNLLAKFKHIGSLFNIQVKNISETETLDKVTKAHLIASSDIPAYSNSGAGTYNVTTKSYSDLKTRSLTFLPVSSSNIVSKGILEFWAWIPMEPGEEDEGVDWPELGLQIESNGSPITATTTKGTRKATVGKTYYLFATCDGTALTFATAAEMTVAPGKLADFRDGNLYNTVAIGSQIWMAENLAYLPFVSTSNPSATSPYYFVYGHNNNDVAGAKDDITNYKTYGVLYNWPAAMQGAETVDLIPSGVQGVCPAGWHLPSKAEWETLRDYLIATGYNYDGTTTGNKIAKSMAADRPDLWKSTGVAAMPGNFDDLALEEAFRNKSGFTAFPGGYRGSGGGGFQSIGESGIWSCSTESGKNGIYAWNLSYDEISLTMATGAQKARGFSVRCVRD